MDHLRLQDINEFYAELDYRDNQIRSIPQRNHTYTEEARAHYIQPHLHQPIKYHCYGNQGCSLVPTKPYPMCCNSDRCDQFDDSEDYDRYEIYLKELLQENIEGHLRSRENYAPLSTDVRRTPQSIDDQEDRILRMEHQLEGPQGRAMGGGGSGGHVYSAAHIRNMQARTERNNRNGLDINHTTLTQKQAHHGHRHRR
ncbi:hypothetical protein T484DRAFT_1757429 [Baffinella frigidus]|nr:hypothetical protein T484DRAFT_1757429 [Cryptophyta sp. CCMP2293]